LFKKTIFPILIIILSASLVYAGERLETKSSPNYIVILVHGINSPGWVWRGEGQNGSDVNDIPGSMRGKGDLLGYLRNNLGLDGYVYYYTFSQRDGRIPLTARELGDPSWDNPGINGSVMNHKGLTDQPDVTDSAHDRKFPYLGYSKQIQLDSSGKGNSWLEQVREDFRRWFQTEGPGSKERPSRPPTKSEIPQKYILICHSMGGLAAREYIFSNYYQNDVAALITIDTPHEGASSSTALRKIKDFYTSGEFMLPFGGTFYAAVCAGMAGNDYLCGYLASSAFMLSATGGIFYEWFTESQLGYYDTQPAVKDMDPNNSYISSLSSKRLKEGSDPVKVKIIAGFLGSGLGLR